MTKQEAVDELRQYDHAFVTEKGVQKFAKLFGVTLKPWRHFADPNEPKGLTLKDGAESAVGLDAAYMAAEICRQIIGHDPGAIYIGRGKRFWACCNALEKHFAK